MDKAIALYETLNKESPSNEILMTISFFSCLHTSDFSKQQQYATQMFQTFKRDCYYFYRVLSAIMQGKKDSESAKLFLPLAEKLMEKAAKEGRIKKMQGLSVLSLLVF